MDEKKPTSEKRGCRYCKGCEVHLATCPLDDADSDYPSPVLDSERSPGRHEFVEQPEWSSTKFACAHYPTKGGYAGNVCGQPRDAEVHQVAQPQIAHLPASQMYAELAPQPQPEAARCAKCGHDANDKRRRGSDEYSSFCIYGCGCECTFPAPVEAPAVAEGADSMPNRQGAIDLLRSLRNVSPEEAEEQRRTYALLEKALARHCTWTEDSDGNWDTSCDNKYVIVEGTPTENGMKFCAYCGKRLEEARIGHEQ